MNARRHAAAFAAVAIIAAGCTGTPASSAPVGASSAPSGAPASEASSAGASAPASAPASAGASLTTGD